MSTVVLEVRSLNSALANAASGMRGRTGVTEAGIVDNRHDGVRFPFDRITFEFMREAA